LVGGKVKGNRKGPSAEDHNKEKLTRMQKRIRGGGTYQPRMFQNRTPTKEPSDDNSKKGGGSKVVGVYQSKLKRGRNTGVNGGLS